ncbi:MAG: hypothetical protein HYS36_08530 [Candidatus Rokubacteria bacterium]|nr:hypothetical protein [Candidatus Rokubacteria bacterium]
MPLAHRGAIRVADEVWIAAALLHREQPTRDDFSVAEIVERARLEAIEPALRPGVYVHAVQHCVANRPPNPGRSRMLVETGRNRRRLYRPGDPCDPRREGARIVPGRDDIPAKYHPLLDWYEESYARRSRRADQEDVLLGLRGSGRALWAAEPADQYVTRLREGWE